MPPRKGFARAARNNPLVNPQRCSDDDVENDDDLEEDGDDGNYDYNDDQHNGDDDDIDDDDDDDIDDDEEYRPPSPKTRLNIASSSANAVRQKPPPTKPIFSKPKQRVVGAKPKTIARKKAASTRGSKSTPRAVSTSTRKKAVQISTGKLIMY